MTAPVPIFTRTENVPLAPFTTLGVGGSARYFCAAETERQLRHALRWADEQNLPVFVLGGGSNLVIADAGFPGLVVRADIHGINTEEGTTGRTLVTVGAGEKWDDFVRFCVTRNLQGIECLAGIPGAVGGTPVQNVGAYGQEVSETIVSVRALDQTSDTVYDISAAECGFAYRQSRFNTTEAGRWVILSVTFALAPNAPPALKYADLRAHFDGTTPTLIQVYDAVRTIRARKGMVHSPDDPDSHSAGSFFKNPVVSLEDAACIAETFGDTSAVPQWTQPGGNVKLSAAWLIERAGFVRGHSFGSVGLSGKHVLALVNRGGATAREVCDAARQIQEGVKAKWGVLLSPEPVFVGFTDADALPQNATRFV